MLSVNMEFRKGILFVRLDGSLNKDNSNQLQNNLFELVKNNAIKYIVLNVEGLSSIDKIGIKSIRKNYEEIAKNKGKFVICGMNHEDVKKSIKNSNLYRHLYETSDELGAFNLIHIWA